MTPKEFKDHIAKLGLSQERAGQFMGVSKRQGQRWASGVAKIPASVSKLLHMMVQTLQAGEKSKKEQNHDKRSEKNP